MRAAASSLALAGMLSCFRGGGSTSSTGGPQANAASDAATTQLLDEAGTGRCTTDAECVLSDYQQGCCTQACEPNAVNRAELAATLAEERDSCEALRERELCPPPGECPPSEREVVSTKCVNETCYRVVKARTATPPKL